MELVDDLDCQYCGEESVYMDVKEEPTLYKVGAQCVECDYDYGVVERVSRSGIHRVDDVYELGEDSVKQLLNGK
jgi:hypothetical protein